MVPTAAAIIFAVITFQNGLMRLILWPRMFEISDSKRPRAGLGPHKTIPSTKKRDFDENYLHEPIRTGFDP